MESREPGQPDILCLINGERRYFEITRGADKSFEEILTGRNPNVHAPCPFPIDTCQNVCDRLNEKLDKRYLLSGHRADLLIYLEYPIERTLMPRMLKASGLERAVRAGPFSRIWIYDPNLPKGGGRN